MSKQVDLKALRCFRQQAASTFQQVDFLFKEAQERMLNRLDGMKVSAGLTVIFAAQQTEKSILIEPLPYNEIRIVNDLSAMAELDADSCHLIFSNLALSIEDINLFVQQTRRVLAPNGLLFFSLLGPGSLSELRQAFHQDHYPHVHRFYDMHDVGDLLMSQGLESPVMEASKIQINYQNLPTLFSELRQMGVQCVLPERRHGLTGKKTWQTMLSQYPKDSAGKYSLTVELVMGHAWKPPVSSAENQSEQDVLVAMSQIKRRQ